MTAEDVFESNRIVYPKESTIKELQEKIKEACNGLRPDIVFDFNRTKNTESYNILIELLEAYDLPAISNETLHKIFHGKFFLRKGELVLSFRKRIIAIIETFYNKYQASLYQPARGNPIRNTDFLNERELDRPLQNILHNNYLGFRGIVTASEHIEVKEDGTTILTVREKLEAETDITHVMAQYIMYHQGNVIIKSAVNVTTQQDLYIYNYGQDEDSRTFFVVFDEVVEAGEWVEYELVVEIDNFFSELILDKFNHVDRRAPVILKYKTLKEVYKFPDSPLFKSLEVIIRRHPNNKLVKKSIAPKKAGGYKYYHIDHGDLSNFNIEMVVDFRI